MCKTNITRREGDVPIVCFIFVVFVFLYVSTQLTGKLPGRLFPGQPEVCSTAGGPAGGGIWQVTTPQGLIPESCLIRKGKLRMVDNSNLCCSAASTVPHLLSSAATTDWSSDEGWENGMCMQSKTAPPQPGVACPAGFSCRGDFNCAGASGACAGGAKVCCPTVPTPPTPPTPWVPQAPTPAPGTGAGVCGGSGGCVSLLKWQSSLGWVLVVVGLVMFVPHCLSLMRGKAYRRSFYQAQEEVGGFGSGSVCSSCVGAFGTTPFSIFCILSFTLWLIFVATLATQYDSVHGCCDCAGLGSHACQHAMQPMLQSVFQAVGAHLVVVAYLHFFEMKAVFIRRALVLVVLDVMVAAPLIPLTRMHEEARTSLIPSDSLNRDLLKDYGTGCDVAAVLMTVLLSYLACHFPAPNAQTFTSSYYSSSLADGGVLSAALPRLLLFFGE